jgi:hypothetical protein
MLAEPRGGFESAGEKGCIDGFVLHREQASGESAARMIGGDT